MIASFKAGCSVLTHVTGFQPYFYVATLRGFTSNDLMFSLEGMMTYESNIPYTLCFMIDTKVHQNLLRLTLPAPNPS